MARLENPGQISQTRDRSRDDNRFRQVAEARPKDTYYRPEYGWIMSNAQVKKEQEVKGQYDAAIAESEANIARAREDFQRSVASGQGQINSAYDQAISGATRSEQMVPVRVVNRDTVEATYTLPKRVVDDMNANSFNQKNSYTGNYVDGGAFYNVDVRVAGGARGQELHDALRNAATDYDQSVKASNAALTSTYNTERNAQLAGFNESAASQYATASQVWEADLARLRNAYGERVAKGKADYEDSKKKYSDSVFGIDEGLLESPTKMVKTT